jgi:LysR family nitrogen assimilation transcriptional regulator
MQFRQLRYFVKIVDAGSFSRAATIVHIAQPALSQQIAELEERFGVMLLQRSARGVRPTAAGEILYREASSILHQLDGLPRAIGPSSAVPEGTVSLGFASSLAPKLVGGVLEECRTSFPKVTIRVWDGDSLGLEGRIAANSIDLAVLYEDEFTTALTRKPLFRQKMYLISRMPLPDQSGPISLERIAKLPLVLPGAVNGRRTLIDRMFAEAGLKPIIALEADSVGSTILPVGDMSHFGPHAFAKPVLIDPPMYLTCSIANSGDFPLSNAGEAVRDFLLGFIEHRVSQADMPGTEWIART